MKIVIAQYVKGKISSVYLHMFYKLNIFIFQSTKIESLLSDDVNQDLEKLNGLFDNVPNDTLRQILESGLNYMKHNVSDGLNKIHDINHKVDGINFQAFPDIIDEVEFIR